ncbi:AI-2E family transporter [Nocardioides pacificus]
MNDEVGGNPSGEPGVPAAGEARDSGGPGEGRRLLLPMIKPRSRGRLDLPAGAERPDREDEESLAERLTQQLSQQWAQIRAERRTEPAVITSGRSNFTRAQVPWGLDLAAAWAWRFLVIAGAGYLVLWLSAKFALVTVPVAVALLISALATPAVRAMHRVGIPRGLAAGLVIVLGLAALTALLTFVGQQIADGSSQLADQVVQGLGKIRVWLKDGPLHASDSQINSYIEQTQRGITNWSKDGGAVSSVTELGSALTNVFAAFFIVLFSTFFFLADGGRIWAWVVRLAPRAARERLDSSGRVAWVSLTQFVRATVIVALVDAIGIMVVAAILGVPFLLAIGVLVFIGAFVPMVGATVAGAVAVLVALVDQGPVTALLMLGGVILVQQIEGHILQPFLMGRFVSVHPLGVILAITAGILVAGIAGALIAVPLVAAVNAVVLHLADETDPGDDPVEELSEDLRPDGPEQFDDDGNPLADKVGSDSPATTEGQDHD